MNDILEYILTNYTWFLGAAIIILLAIIGSYADKTNFGQGKQETTKEHDEDVLPQKGINDFVGGKNEQVLNNEEIETKNAPELSSVNENNSNNVTSNEIKGNNFVETFDKLNEEVEEVLPEKELVDGDLLDEIDSLSLDKTQKIKLDDIPDLDDVELPKIKDLKSSDEDVWKF